MLTSLLKALFFIIQFANEIFDLCLVFNPEVLELFNDIGIELEFRLEIG